MSGVPWSADGADKRAEPRISLVVPASVRVRNQDFTAKLVNIVSAGAMLETAAPVAVGNKVSVRCGTVAAAAVVIWSSSGRLGVSFPTPLTDAEVREQVARSEALAARRAAAAI